MREKILKVVLIVVGLLFMAGIYPLLMFFASEPVMAMMMSLYVTLGIFLLLAARSPASHCSLIAFAAWSSLAHAAVMAVQAARHILPRHELAGVAVFGVIGIVLIALSPGKQAGGRTSAAGA